MIYTNITIKADQNNLFNGIVRINIGKCFLIKYNYIHVHVYMYIYSITPCLYPAIIIANI